ncbi:MAG: ABC-2 transporter permease [bacterium]|nr:ABC-2 transporter permease [bacterium]MDY4108319.1 ABC-2 transporter permease [Bacilli bacterium]
MVGLIKKDLLMIKSNLKMVLIMLVVFFIMSLQGEFDISFVPPFIVVMLFMSTFSYDEFNKWDAYAVTLPNGRKNVVKSKYFASLILTIVTIILTIILNSLVGLINNNLEFDKFISTIMGCVFGVILIQSIMYPFIFKYGMEKGRIGLFVISFAIVGIIGLLSSVLKINIPTNVVTFFDNYWFVIIPLISIVLLLISYKISEKIYLKKEF